jgi:drug/metabolite transporter (DMT)-like permease
MLPRDFALLLVVCLVWASNFVVSKLAVSALSAPPLFFSAARLGVVLLCVLPWLFPMPRPRWRMVAIGLLMGAGSFGLMNIGLMTATPSSAAVLVQLGVPITTLLSVVILGERIGRLRGLGIALTFAGAVTVMWDPHGFTFSVGLLFVLGNAFCTSLGAVMMKQTRGVRPLQFQAWVGLSSVLPLAALSAVLETRQIPLALEGGWAFLAVVLYAALGVSVFGHTLYFGLIQKYEANLIASLTLMCPIMAIGLGVALTGDPFDARMMLGTAVVLAGVLLILLAPKRAAAPAKELAAPTGRKSP